MILKLRKAAPNRNKQPRFLSGRHRVAAMIGRLIRGEKYFPFNVYKV